MSPRSSVTWFPLGLRHSRTRSIACTAARLPRSTHSNENASPAASGTNRTRPGLLVRVWSPTLVLRTRNSTGAPEICALTVTASGKIDDGESLRPGTFVKVVEDVDVGEVRH